jgi:cobalt-zinc-cadmium efflux system protein
VRPWPGYLHPEPVRASVMLVAAAVAFLANVGSVLLLRTHSAEDINVRSAFLHLAQDALASLAVVVAALFARTAVGRYVDPAAAILIGVVVLRSAISIVQNRCIPCWRPLPREWMWTRLAGEVARRFTDVRLHHVHAWEVGPGQRVLTAHMKVGATTLLEVEAIAAEVRSFLHENWGITHATLEAEANGCGREDLLGDWK